MDTIRIVFSTIFGGAWELFQTPVPIPGLSLNYGHIVLASLFGSAALSLVMYLITGSTQESKGRNSRNPKISKERANDTK